MNPKYAFTQTPEYREKMSQALLKHWANFSYVRQTPTTKEYREARSVGGKRHWARTLENRLRIKLVNDGIRHGGGWRQHLKSLLVQAKWKVECCEICGLGPEWNEKSLVLQIDHINGDAGDHQFENIRLICPNCHSQTETFTGRKNKGATGRIYKSQ